MFPENVETPVTLKFLVEISSPIDDPPSTLRAGAYKVPPT